MDRAPLAEPLRSPHIASLNHRLDDVQGRGQALILDQRVHRDQILLLSLSRAGRIDAAGPPRIHAPVVERGVDTVLDLGDWAGLRCGRGVSSPRRPRHLHLLHRLHRETSWVRGKL